MSYPEDREFKTIEQDPETGLWHWYDETWHRSGTGYQSEAQVKRVQNAYVRRELENGWRPERGDYCWLAKDDKQVPVRVKGPANGSHWDWHVAVLVGRRRSTCVFDYDLLPMTDMEVIAAAASDDASD